MNEHHTSYNPELPEDENREGVMRMSARDRVQ